MAKAVAKMAPKSKPAPQLPAALMVELERRRAGLARHMARAVVAVVHWDDSTGVPPQRDAIAKACEAGLDLFLATAREARPATAEELRRVAQLGILQARSSQSVEPVLAAYRIAARVAWDAILRAWRGHPEVTPEALMITANYVFAALDQVAAEVTKTYLHAREQHMQRGTRARARLFHALISDNFDSELELQKQALTLNMPLGAVGYVATVCTLMIGPREGARGGDSLAEVVNALELPRGVISHTTDPTTLVILWPADSAKSVDGAADFVMQMNAEAISRSGKSRAHVRETLGVLLDPATRNREQLMETLEVHLARGSVKDSAAELKLHRHTVLYRLDRLRELLGRNLDEPATRLRLQLAIGLRKLL